MKPGRVWRSGVPHLGGGVRCLRFVGEPWSQTLGWFALALAARLRPHSLWSPPFPERLRTRMIPSRHSTMLREGQENLREPRNEA